MERQKFIIEVICNENSTWQGSIQWVNENKKENFRSTLEMIRLIDSTLVQPEAREDTAE